VCFAGAKSRGGLILCTDSFTVSDIILLMNVLTLRYNLNCSIHRTGPRGRNQYRMYISVKSMDKLIEIVKPHMVPSMLYKLGL